MYCNDTGFLSVSDIVGPWQDKRWFTDKHRKRGTIVHGAMAAHALDVWHPAIHKELVPYVDSGIEWYETNVTKVLCVEERFVDKKNKYTGQIDILAETLNDGLALIDWKTSVAAYDIWELTTGGYANLINVELDMWVDTRMTVRLRKESGKKALVNYWEGAGVELFLGAAQTINFLGMPVG